MDNTIKNTINVLIENMKNKEVDVKHNKIVKKDKKWLKKLNNTKIEDRIIVNFIENATVVEKFNFNEKVVKGEWTYYDETGTTKGYKNQYFFLVKRKGKLKHTGGEYGTETSITVKGEIEKADFDLQLENGDIILGVECIQTIYHDDYESFVEDKTLFTYVLQNPIIWEKKDDDFKTLKTLQKLKKELKKLQKNSK